MLIVAFVTALASTRALVARGLNHDVRCFVFQQLLGSEVILEQRFLGALAAQHLLWFDKLICFFVILPLNSADTSELDSRLFKTAN